MKKPIYFVLAWFFIFGVAQRLSAQCLDCGNGSEGVFNALNNTTLTGGLHNFSSFSIAPGVTVRVTGNQILQIKVTGNVNIQGTLDLKGDNGADGVTYVSGGLGAIGVAGGGNGGDGTFASATGPLNGNNGLGAGSGGMGMGWSGGGGAGYAAAGGTAGPNGGTGGSAYGTIQIAGNTPGSGGGGGSGGYDCGAGGGGAGGGFVYIAACGTMRITGTINANGGNGGSDGTGNCGGGGGGSGGSIWLVCDTISQNGTLTAIGGSGGASNTGGSPYWGGGGQGANGRIRMDYIQLTGSSGTSNPAVGYTGTLNAMIVQATATQISCYGQNNGSANLQPVGGSPPYTYQWCTGATTASVSGLLPGCWCYTVSDGAGCSYTDSVCITQPDSMTILTGRANPRCHGDCNGTAWVSVTGGSPGYDYLWSNTDTTDSITALCAGSYTVIITDDSGCVDSALVSLSEPSALSLTASHSDESIDSLNDGTASVNVSGGTPGYTYLWSPGGATSDSISGLDQGTYTCTVTDSNGCSDSIQVTIGVLPVGRNADLTGDIFIYPNPANSELFIRMPAGAQQETHVELFDVSGRRLLSSLHHTAANEILKLTLDEIPAGICMLRIRSGEKTFERKISVLR